MEGTAYPPNRKRYYSVFRYGTRSTIRYFTNREDALDYYDRKCKIRNFRGMTLQEYDVTRTPIMKEIYTTSALWSNGAKIRDIGKR